MRFSFQHFKGGLLTVFFLGCIISLLSLLIPSRVVISKSKQIPVQTSVLMDSLSQPAFWTQWFPSITVRRSEIQDLVFDKQEMSWTYKGKKESINFDKQSVSAFKFIYRRDGERPVDNIITCLPVSTNKNIITVEWTSVTELGWLPWNKFAGIFLESMSGSGYEYGLETLSKIMQPVIKEN